MLLERGTENGERGTGNGERGTGNGERGAGNGERGVENGKIKKWEQRRELEMKLLIGPGFNFKFDFVPIFHFPVSGQDRSPSPPPRPPI